MKQKSICTTCGTQFPLSDRAPDACPICDDDRQYVPETGQSWTTFEKLKENHQIIIGKLHDNLYELKMNPSFAIGQRALLVLAPEGNILWDCIALLDQPTIEFIHSQGGLRAIAFSHPHFYTTMNEWAETFACPIYIHQNDARFIVNQGRRIELWGSREKELWNEMRLINVGGHFPGSSILQIPFLSPKGVILCGDSFVISPSRKHIAVMHSYPNKIPLPLKEIEHIREQLKPLNFDTIHGWNDSQNISLNAKEILEDSLAKYV
jgi:hypothetical protein